MKKQNKLLFLDEIRFKLEFMKEAEHDEQIIELKKHKFEMISKEDVIIEYENEVNAVNRFLNLAVAEEDFEYCVVLRDFVTLLKSTLHLDLMKYYDLTEEDKIYIEKITIETLK